ncbi:MAG TPA: acyl-CoA dehydrogenase family protein [Pseudomonadales bacterium]
MDFGLSHEQTLLADNVSRFLQDRAPLERVRRFAEERRDDDIWQGLTELGIPGLLVAEEHGGVGLSCLDAAVVAEVLGYHVTPAPFLGTAVAAPIALAAAGAAQHERLAQIAAGRLRVGLAVGEAIGTRADAGVTADAGRLSGKALFVTDFPADCYLVADRHRRLHLVEANADGVGTRALTTIDRTRPTGELVLNGAPAEPLGDDPALLERVLDVARVMLAADTLGAAQSMLDKAVAYAKERRQFNRPIGSFQAVKHMCAEMAAEIEPCRAMIWYAAHALDHLPDEAHSNACQTKAHLAEVGKFVAKTATEVHGGMGFTDLLGLHYWFKRIGYNRQMLGAPELLRDEAARALGLYDTA